MTIWFLQFCPCLGFKGNQHGKTRKLQIRRLVESDVVFCKLYYQELFPVVGSRGDLASQVASVLPKFTATIIQNTICRGR